MVYAQELSGLINGSAVEYESPDDVVISGMSIRCAQSENIEEFAANLYNGVNMVHEDLTRCDQDFLGVPKQHGFINDIRKFDATFFGVHPKQAEGMDPQLRILHEVAYESIIDAGVDPAELKNSNTGVFMGMSNSDAREAWSSGDVSEIDGYSLIGTHRAFLANRLSYTFDLRGPSFGVDAACATSGVAINQGYLHIKHGVCDAALVGGVSLLFNPKVSYQILKLGLLAKDGKCKVFDEAADGYVRSEAIVCIMLQKRKNARRVYATILHSKINNDGFKEQGITFPCTESQGQLIREVYAEAGVDPEDVEFVEAHGSGTRIGDPQEVNGIALGFATTRSKPLPIGAVKSNMGHSEHASGAVSVCKVMIALQTGIIPPNLHYKNPSPMTPALVDGRLQVVTEPLPWNCTLAGINCFGFGGQNSHIVVRGNPRTGHTAIKDIRLVVYVGRTEQAARDAMEYVHRCPDNPYVPFLLMQSAFAKPASMPWRAYTLLNSDEPRTVVERVGIEQRPVWWIFSGQGSQWASMGQQMLTLEFFRNSIEKCAVALEPYKLDLVQLLSTATEADYDDPTISFVGIAAIQVALVDLLQALKISAEGFIGHSAGEIGCAYADGCLTAEEAVLTAYWRGRAVNEASLAPGAMASVGLSFADATEMCKNHPEVNVACNNAEDNVTVSGPTDAVSRLVEELKAKKVFVKEVKSYGIAFHSPAMLKASPIYLQALKKTLPGSKYRTGRWFSTSIPEAEWNSDLAKTCSADYFAHNLRTTVKFHEAMQKVPKNAVCIEIAPHGLLQALIKKTVGPQTVTVALMKRGAPNNVQYFLESIGKLYLNGLNPHVNDIFPKPSLPAPRDTPFIGSVVQWDHSANWRIPNFTDFFHNNGPASSQRTTTIDLEATQNAHYNDHKINGRAVFPVGGLIGIIAKAFTAETGITIEKCPQLQLSNLIFPGEPIDLDQKTSLAFTFNLVKSSGNFELLCGGNVVMTGYIAASTTPHGKAPVGGTSSPSIDQVDVYHELAYRGYDFGPMYRVLRGVSVENGRVTGSVTAGHYETAIDGLLQLHLLSSSMRQLVRVSQINSLTVDLQKLTTSAKAGIRAEVLSDLNVTTTSGLEMEGVSWTPLSLHEAKPAYTLREATFVSFTSSAVQDPLTVYAQLCSSFILVEAARLCSENKVPKQLMTLIQSHQGLLNAQSYSHQDIMAYLDQGDAGFLQLLTSVFTGINGLHYETVGELVKKTVPEYATLLQNDFYLGKTGCRKSVSHLLELAIENFPGNEIQVLELIQSGQRSVVSPWSDQVPTLPNLNVDFETLTVDSDQPVKYQPASVSVLIAKNYFIHGIGTLSTQLRQLSAVLADDGFLVVVQPVGKYVNLWNLFGAFGEDSQKQALPDIADLTEALTEAGLHAVASHHDGVVNSTLLCRKIRQPVKGSPPTVLPVPHFHDSKDVEHFLDHVSEKAQQDGRLDGGRRVWLTMPVYEHAVVSAVVARHKASNGGLFRVAVGPSGTIPHDIFVNDMLVNVDHDNTWGTFRTHVLPPTTNKPKTKPFTTTNSQSRIQPPVQSDIVRPYVIAAYGLLELAHATHPGPSQSMLIHADPSTFEFEAVARVASLLGFRVFVVGLTSDQARLASERLDNFKDITLFDSPLTPNLLQHIRGLTNGKGVAVVYNTSTSSKLRESTRLLQQGGVYLEPNSLLTEASPLDLYHAVNHRVVPHLKFASGFPARPIPRVDELVQQGFSNGAFVPLPSMDRASVKNEGLTGSYVVLANDEEDLGIKVAHWLATQGATVIHFVTSGSTLRPSTEAQLKYVTSADAKFFHHVDHPDVVRDIVHQGPLAGLFVLQRSGDVGQLNHLDKVLVNTKTHNLVVVNLIEKGRCSQVGPQQHQWLKCRQLRGQSTIFVNAVALSTSLTNGDTSDEQQEPTASLSVRAFMDAVSGILLKGTAGIFFVETVKTNRKKPQSNVGHDSKEGRQDKSQLPHTVSKIMGIKDLSSMEMFLSLGDYGIDSIMALELGQVLERDFDQSLTLQEIRALLVRDIFLMSRSPTTVGTAKSAEDHNQSTTPELLPTVSRHYNLSEIVPKSTVVPLSQASDSKVILFIIHPMEGAVLPGLATLANHLQVTTFGLNCTREADMSTIETLANFYLQATKKVQPQGPYNLAGYSFGACVAFEMALQLQERQETVENLVLLDGSHSFVAAFTKVMKAGYTIDPTATVEQLNIKKENTFHDTILTMFVTQFVKTQRKTLQEKMAAVSGLESKIEVTIEELQRCPELRHIPAEELSQAARLFAGRLMAADVYKPTRKYAGNISLIKCSEAMVRNLGDLYELDKVCAAKVSVLTVSGNHEGFVQDAARSTANHINDILRS